MAALAARYEEAHVEEGEEKFQGTTRHASWKSMECPMHHEPGGISFRPMSAAAVGVLPISHQGDAAAVRLRIADLGASARRESAAASAFCAETGARGASPESPHSRGAEQCRPKWHTAGTRVAFAVRCGRGPHKELAAG